MKTRWPATKTARRRANSSRTVFRLFSHDTAYLDHQSGVNHVEHGMVAHGSLNHVAIDIVFLSKQVGDSIHIPLG